MLARSKDVIGRRQANDIVRNRLDIMNEIRDALFAHFETEGIVPESIQLEDIKFSDEFEARVEQRMQAEIDVATRLQQLEQTRVQADMARAEAEGIRDRNIFEAEGKSEAIRLVGEAEAKAIAARGQALRNNPDLIRLVEAERWNGTLPSTMIPNQSIPVIGTK